MVLTTLIAMNFEQAILPLFGIGAISYFFSIFKIYTHAKMQAYKPEVHFPTELFKFISLCSKKQKEHNDKEMKMLLIWMNLSFAFCTTVILVFAFT